MTRYVMRARDAWLGARHIPPRIAHHIIETSDRLGRHRWVIEHSLAWLTGYRWLTLRPWTNQNRGY